MDSHTTSFSMWGDDANTTNSSETTTCPNGIEQNPLFAQDRTKAALVPVVFCVIFVIGIVGNGLLVWIVFRNKTMHNTPNILIVSLAVGDIFLLVFSVPFKATHYTFVSYPYGLAVCKLATFAETLSLGVSVFTLTVLSWGRYLAITRPIQVVATGHRFRNTFLVVVAIWVTSALLASLESVKTTVQVFDFECKQSIAVCNPVHFDEKLYMQLYVIFRFLIYFLLPVATISAFYCAMARTLFTSVRLFQASTNGASSGGAQRSATGSSQMASRKKVAKIVLSFIVIFIICWLPFYVYLFSFTFFERYWLTLKLISLCLSFLNSCVNPVALYFLSKQFREQFKRYLLCRCSCRRTDKALTNERKKFATLMPSEQPQTSHILMRNMANTNTVATTSDM